MMSSRRLLQAANECYLADDPNVHAAHLVAGVIEVFVVFDVVTDAQVLERTVALIRVAEHVTTTAVGNDEEEASVAHDVFDTSDHDVLEKK
jgi:hypothetical protein